MNTITQTKVNLHHDRETGEYVDLDNEGVTWSKVFFDMNYLDCDVCHKPIEVGYNFACMDVPDNAHTQCVNLHN